MNDKAINQSQQQQQQQQQPWLCNNSAVTNTPVWQPAQYGQMPYYANQTAVTYPALPSVYPNPYYQFYNQRQIAYNNANNALAGVGYGGHLATNPPPMQQEDHEKNKANVMPPLPPGPPPPINGQTTTSNCATPVTNQGASYYGQPQNIGYAPIVFNMGANKKAGLGFQSKLNNSGGNGGAGKKKRKKNKNNQMGQMNQMQFKFQSAGIGNTYSGTQPPLPKEVAPPPLPPLPAEPVQTSAVSSSTNQDPGFRLQTNVFKNKNGPDSVEPWPESLRAYVNRCYAMCVEIVDKDQVEIILKGKITRATNDGSLWDKNWDMELLPSLYSQRKTMEIKKSVPMSPSLVGSDMPKNSLGVQRGPPGLLKRGRGGLSVAMGSRLGGFNRGRSRSRSFSPRRNRSKSREVSRSPRRRKARSSDTSPSSDENFKPINQKAKQRNGRHPGRAGKVNNQMKRAKKLKQEESHFYSEHGTIGKEPPVNTERLEKRAARFQGSLRDNSPGGSNTARRKILSFSSSQLLQEATITDVDWRNFHIVGTCRDVDKQYLRQTTAPDASTIRPVEVLQKSLAAVQARWKKDSDYYFACDRMKSIRLDLTLQGVRNEFTVKVYETHARIALEKGDHQELNQCLSQLAQLYLEVGGVNRLEFTAYGILYYVFTKDTLELTTLLSKLSEKEKLDPCIAHAISVRTAWVTSNYHRFFKLYQSAPRMGSYAMGLFVPRERLAALKVMVKAYRPLLPVSYVTKELAFETNELCLEFLVPLGIVFADAVQRSKIECKESTPIVVKL